MCDVRFELTFFLIPLSNKPSTMYRIGHPFPANLQSHLGGKTIPVHVGIFSGTSILFHWLIFLLLH